MKVLYYYDEDVGNYMYGNGHPMKPHRVRMANSLLESYGVLDRLDARNYNHPCKVEDALVDFHTEDYIDFLKTVSPGNMSDYTDLFVGFNMGEDCPVFDGLWDYCKKTTSGSIIGATAINEGSHDLAINWSGGFHHAKEGEASGFCYINDCVLGILELLKKYYRVLYLDIDIHHGDGVEEAFYTTDRVMTCSFHKFGNYFPDTGYFTDTGYGRGHGYSVNFPLAEGMDDENFRTIFKPVMSAVMDHYQPQAVVMQCGADSLSGDRLGCFNLSVRGHGECVEFMKQYGVPILFLGGGGYTLRNVARCWAYETSIITGQRMDPLIPEWDNYRGYYGPDFTISPPISNMENQNSREYLRTSTERVVNLIKENVQPVSPTISNYTVNPLHNTVNPLFSRENYRAHDEMALD